MLSIDSALWQLRSYNDRYVNINQRASGVIRTVKLGSLPSAQALAAMNERKFNSVCREAFYKAGYRSI